MSFVACSFYLVDGHFVCCCCGWRCPIELPQPPHRNCTHPCDRSDSDISLGQKVIRYSTEVLKWIAAGRPVRGDAEVSRIFDTICSPCEYFDADRRTCKHCGCRVRRDGAAMTNKLKMATTVCPLTPPKWS